MMRRLVVASALVIVSTSVVTTARAQSLPNISRIKQTTNTAVAKTNAHTLAMTYRGARDAERARRADLVEADVTLSADLLLFRRTP